MNGPQSHAPMTPSPFPKLSALQWGALGVVILIFIGTLAYKSGVWQGVLQQYGKPASSQNAVPPVSTSAPNVPAVKQLINLGLTVDVQSTDNGNIKGLLTVTNTSSFGMGGLYYTLTLQAPLVVTPTNQTKDGKPISIARSDSVAYSESKDSFQIAGNQTRSIPFEISYSPHLSQGDYTLQANVLTSIGDVLSAPYVGTPTKTVHLVGSSDMLSVNGDSCVVVVSPDKNNAEGRYYNLIAPIVSKGSKVWGTCDITNPTSRQITVQQNLTYAFLHVLNYPASPKQTTNEGTISFLPNETKAVTFPLPTDLSPTVYESLATLTDSSGNSQVPLLVFRWTIPGQSGRVEKLNLDKDQYSSGDTAKVTLTADPSMDLWWRVTHADGSAGTELQNPSLSLVIEDSAKAICGQTNYPIKSPFLAPQTLSVPVSIQKDCKNPYLTAKLLSGDTELASADMQIISSSILPINWVLLMGGAMVIVAGAIIFLAIRRRRSGQILASLLLLFVTLCIFSVIYQNKVSAQGIAGTAVSHPGPVTTESAAYNNNGLVGATDDSVTFSGSEDSSGTATVHFVLSPGTDQSNWCGNPNGPNILWFYSPVASSTSTGFPAPAGWTMIESASQYNPTLTYSNLGPATFYFVPSVVSFDGSQCESIDSQTQTTVPYGNGTVTQICYGGGPAYGNLTLAPSCTNSDPPSFSTSSPSNGSVVNAGSTGLSWNAPSSFGTNCSGNNNQYQVHFGTNSNPGVVATDSSGTTNYDVTSLTQGITYYWDICASNNGFTSQTCTSTYSFTVSTLTVDLTGNGQQSIYQSYPLSLDASANTGGTATGTMNYTFYCNRQDTGTNVTSPYDAKFDDSNNNPETISSLCNYTTAGTYYAKVIVERGPWAAQDQVVITLTNTPPTVSGLTVDPPSAALFCGNPQEHFSWTFSDQQDGNTQTAYELQVSSNSNFSSPEFDSGKVASSSQQRFVSVSSSPSANQLAFNTNYYWRVRVYDNADASSGWVNGSSFATPRHAWPSPAFTWSPSVPDAGDKVIFTDQTIFASGSTNHSWSWAIPNASYVDSTSSSSENPHVQFNSTNASTVVLTSTDDVGSCSTSSTPSVGNTVNPRPPLPQFKEVQP